MSELFGDETGRPLEEFRERVGGMFVVVRREGEESFDFADRRKADLLDDMRVGLDATPLLGRQTGIGVYTSRLLLGLGQDRSLELVATAFTTRGQRALPGAHVVFQPARRPRLR